MNSSPMIVADIIKAGQKLENNGRWGEALTLYERAHKKHEQSPEIQKRLVNAKTHYDVIRRYSDSRFIQSVRQTSMRTAENIYSEVLLKIDSYFVSQPEWVRLARQGLSNLDVALQTPTFREAYLQGQSDAEVNYAFQRMHQIAKQFRVGSRRNTFDFGVAVANGLANDLGIAQQVVLFEFINGATTALDPYSSYLTGDQYADVMSQIDGNFVGLGVEIKPKKQTLEIVSVIPNGPAEYSGLLQGDFVIEIDNQSVEIIGGESAADMLKGTEGSLVSLKINRNGSTINFAMTRRRVDIPSVQESKIIDKKNGIGYIKLVNFQKSTATAFEAALWKLHRLGMQSLIVDVRENPGGLLTASVDVADLFVSRGVLVSTKGRNPREDFVHQARTEGTWTNLPLTVLIDRDSASASEIFAGAIRDLNRGTIVGETSYGKGSVQGIFPLNVARGGIRLTTAKFYSPIGTAISDRGVQPDVLVQKLLKPDLNSPLEKEGNQMIQDSILKTGLMVAIKKNK
ncbi:MAG: S41 family peptidase [Pirellulaceae bacterium]|nr:S41 family peptidase [Pirellulaceae bacterium]